MVAPKAVNLLVFRETRERVATRTLVDQLVRDLERVDECARDPEKTLNALIRAGELECGLRDASSAAADNLAAATDWLANMLIGPQRREDVPSCIANLVASPVPDTITVSPPEGFAYYALHPLDFAKSAAQLDVPASAAVVGIRSIGTVLSAAAKAALEQRGTATTRITVRPTGHPYDRVTEFSPGQRRWVNEQKQRGSKFVVVDEGPGLSGSSFLSVGEALLRQGVHSDQIIFMGTRKPENLCSRDAEARSRKFQWTTVQGDFYRGDDRQFLSGGTWRTFCFENDTDWPASWTQMERLKFLSPDRKHLLKFEGLGRFGERANQRAICIAEAGFGPVAERAGDGLLSYEFIDGKPLRASDVSLPILEQMARYCAFRTSEFRVNAPPGATVEMTRFNCAQEFRVDLPLPDSAWETTRPVIVDGRMQPQEWIAGENGTILKVDTAAHGDDHFFPGPTDIVWDLAGSIVEWNLDKDAADFLVSRYAQLSGDNPRARMAGFLLAYGVFRLSYCRMAENAAQQPDECLRLRRAYEFYRARVVRELAKLPTPERSSTSSEERGVRASGGSSSGGASAA